MVYIHTQSYETALKKPRGRGKIVGRFIRSAGRKISIFAFVRKNQFFMATSNGKDGLTLLGGRLTEYPREYAPELLETFKNKHPGNEYLVTFTCPEFTSLCPKTGQPDFGKIIINYIPREDMVESKSLKLYLFSFRNHGDFHEDCVNIIMKDLVRLMNPRYLEVIGLFNPRGGISICPFANYGDDEHQELVKARMSAAFRSDF